MYFLTEIKFVHRFLYNLLSDGGMNKNIPVLVLCNKQDQTLSKSSTVIRTLLEKEMNLLRVTKTSQLEAQDASSSNAYLGKAGKDFTFSHLDRKVDFAECSAFIKDADTPADIEQLTTWLTKLV